MNLRGSHRRLLGNSRAAMLAAIEIYNKPRIAYRDECFTILLTNAWELLFKAILSKNKKNIYYPKERKKSYRTLSLSDAIENTKNFFPASILFEPTKKNIRAIEDYRDRAVHFYNEKGISIVIFGLAQTSIINYRDLLIEIFGIDISQDTSLALLPLALGPKPDPIHFLQDAQQKPPRNRIAADYLDKIFRANQELENQNLDTARFLTTFTVSFQSVKKATNVDVIAGVSDVHGVPQGALIAQRRTDPNVTHPLRRSDILKEIGGMLHGEKFTTYTFQAIVWKYETKSKPHLCWTSQHSGSSQYSNEVVMFIRGLTTQEIQASVTEYRDHMSHTTVRRRSK